MSSPVTPLYYWINLGRRNSSSYCASLLKIIQFVQKLDGELIDKCAGTVFSCKPGVIFLNVLRSTQPRYSVVIPAVPDNMKKETNKGEYLQNNQGEKYKFEHKIVGNMLFSSRNALFSDNRNCELCRELRMFTPEDKIFQARITLSLIDRSVTN